MMKLDLNCDLGEHEPARLTARLMALIGSANIACGGHAGSLESMRRCLRLAKKYGVRAGAHPGLADPKNFGRTEAPLAPEDLALLLCNQISCLAAVARTEGVPLRHVKLHGALYQMVESNAALRRTYLYTIKRFWPGLAIRSIAGGRVEKNARRLGLRTSPELFADRSYLSSTRLTPRSQTGAVISDPGIVAANLRRFLNGGNWPMADGQFFRPQADSLCVHGDSPGATLLLRRLKKLFV